MIKWLRGGSISEVAEEGAEPSFASRVWPIPTIYIATLGSLTVPLVLSTPTMIWQEKRVAVAQKPAQRPGGLIDVHMTESCWGARALGPSSRQVLGATWVGM